MSDRPARVTPQQEAAWRCPRCGSNKSIGYGSWPNSGPLKAQCVPCGKVSDWPKIEREGETKTDHLDRAAEVIAAQMHGLTTPGMCRGIARALEEAGLLVSPERDEAIRAEERAQVRYVVFHADWREPPGDVIAVFATEEEARAHIDGPGDGCGWTVVEVPAP